MQFFEHLYVYIVDVLAGSKLWTHTVWHLDISLWGNFYFVFYYVIYHSKDIIALWFHDHNYFYVSQYNDTCIIRKKQGCTISLHELKITL